MDREPHKKFGFLLLLIFLFILLGFLFWFFFFRSTDITSPTDSQPSTFSPFDRPISPVVRTPTTDIPPPQQQQVSEPEPEPIQSAPIERIYNTSSEAPSKFYEQRYTEYEETFDIPTRTRTPERIVYTDPVTVPPPTNTYAPESYTSFTPTEYEYSSSTSAANTKEDDEKKSWVDSFASLDKEVFGYVSGLGWTQLLGDTGQQIYDTIYSLTPMGTTHATLGSLLGGSGGVGGLFGGGGGGGGMGGGGLGGGGGGNVMNFGGRVTRSTQCTCPPNPVMLDILDVRGQNITLLYQTGVSQLYSYYNVYGTGQNVLGDYTPGGQCMMYSGNSCNSQGSPRGTIRQIGTSAQ